MLIDCSILNLWLWIYLINVVFFKEGEVECKDEEDLDEFDFIIFEIMF